jgi:uncharacterized repeat protein (TIGR02543 family)
MIVSRGGIALLVALIACGDRDSRGVVDARPALDAAIDATIDAAPDPEITVTLAGDGSGTITSAPAGITCGPTCASTFPRDTVVTLTAVPDTGSVFASWGGACSGTTPTCTVTVDAAKAVTATFDVATYTVTVTKTGGAGTVAGNGIDCGETCTATVAHGTTITLAATPASLSVFAGWGGACSGTAPCTVTVTSDTAIIAAFGLVNPMLTVIRVANTPDGVVTSTPEGISCEADCSHAFPTNQTVVLSALSTGSSNFTGWSGPCSGTGTCTITMDAPKVVTATFQATTFELRVFAGNGTVTSNPPGIDCGFDCMETYNYGQSVTLTATPDPGYRFVAWGSSCTGSGECTVSMGQKRRVNALFYPNSYALTVTPPVNGTITGPHISCPGDCEYQFKHGESVTLTASAAPGYELAGWNGACAGTSPTCTVQMFGAQTVTATFTAVDARR